MYSISQQTQVKNDQELISWGPEYVTEKCAEARNILEKFYGYKNLRQLKYPFLVLPS